MDRTSSEYARVRFDFGGLRVLVTGGTRGIGAAIARAFHATGAELLITGTAADASAYTEIPPGAEYRQLRLTEAADIAALGVVTGRLDVLVNNAGGTGGASSPYDFDTALQVNLSSVFHLTEALSDALARSELEGGAAVVNLASEMSLFASPYFFGYGAAKAGVVQLTRSHCAAWRRAASASTPCSRVRCPPR